MPPITITAATGPGKPPLDSYTNEEKKTHEFLLPTNLNLVV
jgi:hypothetical protein